MNATRFAHSLPAGVRVLRPTGTTSNEALHSELNSAFRRIQALHKSSLETRLAFFTLAKLLSHNAALYRAGLAQTRSAFVMARTLGPLDVFTSSQWTAWCKKKPCGSAQRADRAAEKADARKVADDLVEAAVGVRKRPAAQTSHPPPAKRAPTDQRHRSVFQLSRPNRVWH